MSPALAALLAFLGSLVAYCTIVQPIIVHVRRTLGLIPDWRDDKTLY